MRIKSEITKSKISIHEILLWLDKKDIVINVTIDVYDSNDIKIIEFIPQDHEEYWNSLDWKKKDKVEKMIYDYFSNLYWE